jgi:signal transduction histidine kinase
VRVTLLFLWLLIFTKSYAADGYIDAVRHEVITAKTDEQKIAAYEKWLPLSILIHQPDTKNDLAGLKLLAEKTKSALADGIYNLNMAYYTVENFGDYNRGLELCMKAKTIFEQLNAKPQLVMTYNRLAFLVLWNQIGKQNAIVSENINDAYLSKALAFSKELNNKTLEIITLGYIGSYYNVTEENNRKALTYFFEAEALLNEKTPPDAKLVILESIAIVYADLHDEDGALAYLSKCEALPFFQTFGYGQSNMYRSIAKMYLKRPVKPDFNKALMYANRAYSISVSMNAPEYISQGEQRLFEIYKAMGNDKLALEYHEKYKQHEDSLARERFQRTYAEYDVVKKEATIKTLENDKLKQTNKWNSLIGWGLLSLLAAGIVFAAYAVHNNRRLKQINEKLSEKNEEIGKALIKGQAIERKRVAADLHDSLGVQANSILYNAELLKSEPADSAGRIDFLHETAKEMLLNLRETLWAMKADDIAAMDVWLRIVNFCQQVGRHYKTMHIGAEGLPPANFLLESPRALHIVMIVQEAVNNAIKHADATSVTVSSTTSETGWQISVKDDGKGFDKEAVKQKKDSYGLINMQERATAADLKYDVQTVLHNGTNTVITVNSR